jgi:hypothetical protein|tara:strand:- start:12 stop:401 length:390 start_codon:yes stop_codon:yes gene_type:complete
MSNTMGNKYESSSAETLSGAKTLAVTDAKYQFLDPGGSGRNVDLPDMRTLTTDINSEGTGDAGTDRYVDQQTGYFVISNTADAAEVLTVRGWNGSSTTGTIMTPTQNETAICIWTGATNGWIGIAGSDA